MGGMAKLFLPLYLHQDYHVPYPAIGLMVSAYGLGALTGSYGGGSLSDRFDTSLLARLFLFGAALCLILLSLPLPLWLFAPILLLSGLCDGAFRPVNQRLAFEPCTPRQRPVAVGLLRVAFNLGVAISGITGGFLAALGYHWIYLSDGIAAALAASWMSLAYHRFPVQLEKRQREPQHADAPLASPWRDPVYLRMLLGMVLVTAAFDQLYSTLGLFLHDYNHLGPHWLGALFTLNGLMIVLLQVPLARQMHRWGVARYANLGALLTGLGYLLLLIGPAPWWPILMLIVVTTGELLMAPSFTQLVMTRAEGRLRGRYMGLYNAAWTGRTLFAPALGTWTYGALGPHALWLGCALLGIVAVLIQRSAIQLVLQPDATAPPAKGPDNAT